MTIDVFIINKDETKNVTITIKEHLKDSPNIVLRETKQIIKPKETRSYLVYDRRSILITEEKEEVDNG